MSTNFHTVIPQQSSQYHHLSSLKSYIHFHNFFTISTHHPHSPLTDFSHAFIHHSHTTGHIETPFRPSKQTSTRLCSRTIHIPTTLSQTTLRRLAPHHRCHVVQRTFTQSYFTCHLLSNNRITIHREHLGFCELPDKCPVSWLERLDI